MALHLRYRCRHCLRRGAVRWLGVLENRHQCCHRRGRYLERTVLARQYVRLFHRGRSIACYVHLHRYRKRSILKCGGLHRQRHLRHLKDARDCFLFRLVKVAEFDPDRSLGVPPIFALIFAVEGYL